MKNSSTTSQPMATVAGVQFQNLQVIHFIHHISSFYICLMIFSSAGLQRCGKSCRLRWINYLRPDLKRGSFSPQEAALIIELHSILGNRFVFCFLFSPLIAVFDDDQREHYYMKKLGLFTFLSKRALFWTGGLR